MPQHKKKTSLSKSKPAAQPAPMKTWLQSCPADVLHQARMHAAPSTLPRDKDGLLKTVPMVKWLVEEFANSKVPQ